MSSIPSIATSTAPQPVPRQTAELDKAQDNAETKSRSTPPPAPQAPPPTDTIGNNLNVVA